MSTRYTIDGYGQVELNNVAFRRDGRIEAQCALDSTAFSSSPCENGMLLAVNNIARTVAPVGANNVYPIGLVYTAEHQYDERAKGLKNFKLELGSFLPRLGYLSVGDKFTTNCLCYGTEFASDAAFESACASYDTTKLYGSADACGAICVSTSVPASGMKLLVVKGDATMPNGTFGLKFQVIAD